MRWRPPQLLQAAPEEDEVLEGIEWPANLDVAAPLIGVALTLVTMVVVGFLGAPGTPVDVAGLVLIALSGVPWLVWLLFPERSTRWNVPQLRWLKIEVIVVPLGALNVGGWVGWIDLGTHTAYQLVLFPLLIMLALVVVSRPRRRARLVAVAAYGVVVASIGASARALGQVDWTGLLAWQAAFFLTVAAAVAVRLSAVAIQRRAELVARQAAADERRQVARDVHDVVAHTLAVTMLHITAARLAVARGSSDEATEALEEAERAGRVSLADIRRIVRLLRADDEEATDGPQPDLGDIGGLVDGYRAAGLPVELHVSGPLELVPAHAGLAVYRALQEALANAARHGCGPATVELTVQGNAVELQVANPVEVNGAPPAGGRGSGLRGMQERIGAAGGVVRAGPAGGSWSVWASVPVAGDGQALA
jgi:signal transduction histidine kinase